MMKNKIIPALIATALFGSITTFAADSYDATKGQFSKKSVSSLAARTNELESQIRILKNQIDQIQNKDQSKSKSDNDLSDNSNNQLYSLVEMYAHGPAVVTSPAFGIRSSDEGVADNLMVNLSSINEDMVLLELRKKLDNYATEKGISIPYRPIIVLSGGVEGQVLYDNNNNYTKNSKTDVNLSRAELDVIAEAGPWTTASMIINYEDKRDTNYSNTVARSNHSRIRLDRGFLTIGQLNKFPIYATIGQMYASFGKYASYMVTTPPTQILGRVKDRMLTIGYNQFGVYAQIYGMSGETQSKTGSEIIKHSGFDLGYKLFEHDNFVMDLGAGVLGCLAESEGMQNNVFGKKVSSSGTNPSGGEIITSRVMGINGHIEVDFYNAYTVLAEYIGASKAYDVTDLAFNGHGARPQAFDIQGAYRFKVINRPSTIFAGFSLTEQALALDVPKQSFFAGYTMSIIKNTLASIEYRHDINYSLGDTSTSNNTSIGGTRNISATVTGRQNNTVTLQLGVYF